MSSEVTNNLEMSLAKQGNICYSLLSKRSSTNGWIVDMGATDHMTGSLETLSNFEPVNQEITVLLADGSKSSAQGKGKAYI